MSPIVYQVIHLSSLVVLFGYTFYGFAAAPETRKKVMAITGIATLLVLISGFGMQAKFQHGFPGWLIVKLFCWLGISALMGIGYRKRASAGTFAVIIIALAVVAIVMVYVRPF